MNLSAIFCLIVALLLVIWSFLAKVTFFRDSYEMIIANLTRAQQYIAHLQYKWLIVIVIEMLFAMKTILPVPLSAIFMISGIVFPFWGAVVINGIGMVILMTIKYYWGFYVGGGNLGKLVRKIDKIRNLFEKGFSIPNTVMLFVFRLVPSFPVNSISQLYGSIKFSYGTYIAVSMVGFLPKLMSWSVAGRNVFDPFSFRFTTPLIVICTISGLSILCINKIMTEYINNKDNPDKYEDLK